MIIVLAIGIIGGASWCLVSGGDPLEQKITKKVTEKVVDTTRRSSDLRWPIKPKKSSKKKLLTKYLSNHTITV